MSRARMDPSRDPLKPSNSKFLFNPEAPREVLALCWRISLLSCLAGSISLVLYSAFTNTRETHWLRLPELPRPRPRIPGPDGAAPTNISHILFGIGGSLRTWHDRSRYSSLWWEPNSTRGFVWLDEKPPENFSWPEGSIPYRVSEDATRFKSSSSKSAPRIARIVLESFRLELPNVRWFVMGDDDTVFFPRNLVTVLAKYDHRQMWYIGSNSESVEQDVMHGYSMAFGGGGFAISHPLAAELADILDRCLDRYSHFYGSDQRVWACVREVGVPLTVERGFHQIDIRGDPYGILSAHPVAPLVSLHHLDDVDPIFPHRTQIDALKALMDPYRIDPARILQQSFCYDPNQKWSISISWGYTIQIYPSLVTANVLETPFQMFKTWRTWGNEPFTFNTRPESSDPCRQPVIYFVDTVREAGWTGSLTTYKRSDSKASRGCAKADYARVLAVESITVSSMKMGPDYWNKAPRRQCCEIMDRGSIRSRSMRIRIRKCRAHKTRASPSDP
ncbi:uncharacterized protein LOC115727462 [Rhodamnia argentea]|uniref:Uncharacterized protein LOC115727462 n=1 Tax=Rhodamnia argentea TaxID=178133 RepID=A0A8B8MTY2_9MYRT|nr:uncharacterized protein LOC115727462 [Rhodamnia argentea]XP_030513541.1 uncharacterized protein LOC115727462 [Rhodamnia argentea]